MQVVDGIDTRILDCLQANKRQKHNELARQLNIAQSTVSERAEHMENRGVMTGYRAIVDIEPSGFALKAFISIRPGRHKKETLRRFDAQIPRTPQVHSCDHRTGRYDDPLYVVTANLDEPGSLVKNVMADLPGSVNCATSIIFSGVKTDGALPIKASFNGRKAGKQIQGLLRFLTSLSFQPFKRNKPMKKKRRRLWLS